LPDTEVILQSAEFEAPSIVAGVRAGALGILRKGSPPDELIQAIRAARAGQVYLSSETATKLMRQMQALDDLEPLSETELEVLRLLVWGESNAQIARTLDLSDTLVATHVSAIMTKLHVHSRIEVVLRATRLGLVTADATGRVG
jgi:DNA-binding NarL/FixJ family response regulator